MLFSSFLCFIQGPYKVKEGERIETDRQLLYYRWAQWKNWYKAQPLDNIRCVAIAFSGGGI